MLSPDDDNRSLMLGVVVALIALVIGLGIYKKNPFASAPPAAAGVVASPAAVDGPLVANSDAASVIVENGVVKFYFASSQFALAAGGAEALGQIVREVGNGRRAVVSGFHDSTGSAAANAELARRRAQAVRDALQSLGVSAGKIELKKPEQMQGDGSNAEARRVEVAVQ